MHGELTQRRLLVIEDDARLASVLCKAFGEDGFVVDWADDGTTGLNAALAGGFDCIVLDLMLPTLEGRELCQALRKHDLTTPVLVLTAKDATTDKVDALDAGADDYLVKPFALNELHARVRALLRRTRRAERDHRLCFADLELDLGSQRATRGGRVIELSPKQVALLHYFLRNAGRVISERELLEAVWNTAFHPGTNVVSVYIHHLRNKIDGASEVPLLHTVRGHGYRLGGP